MHRTVSAALILSLTSLLPPAQARMDDPATLALFVPEVADCLATGAPAACDPHRVAMIACASDPTAEACAPLLADPQAVWADPDAIARVQAALAAFAETEMTAPAHRPGSSMA